MIFLTELHDALSTINAIVLKVTDAERAKEARNALGALREEIDMRIALLDGAE